MAEYNSLSSITAEIASHLKKELDEPFKRMLGQSVNNWRSRLLRNSLQDKPNESKFFRQTIYIPMISATALPGCIKGPSLCPVMQSAKPLPKLVRYQTSLVDYIGSVDGSYPFAEETPGMGVYLTAGKYSSKQVFYSFINRYIQVKNHPNLTIIRADGVFEDAMEVMQFNCDAGMNCDYWDLPYPCTGDVVQIIIAAIVDSYKLAPADKDIEVSPQNQEHAPDGK